MRRLLIVVLGGVLVGAGLTAGLWLSRRAPAAPVATAEPAPAREPAAPSPAPPAVTKPAAVSTPRPAAPAPTPEPPKEAPPTTGTLIIESDVPDTSVFIDRVYLGTAPVTVRDLAPGPHRLNMAAAGYDGIFETIDVEPGTRTISIKFREPRLDETMVVVHRHAFGSCQGRLRATPFGLSYETSHVQDAFSVPLTGLETFAVDYLDRNLRVKIRGGKTYNFTDPDGHADRLYAFHQAVDKVRQRMSK